MNRSFKETQRKLICIDRVKKYTYRNSTFERSISPVGLQLAVTRRKFMRSEWVSPLSILFSSGQRRAKISLEIEKTQWTWLMSGSLSVIQQDTWLWGWHSYCCDWATWWWDAVKMVINTSTILIRLLNNSYTESNFKQKNLIFFISLIISLSLICLDHCMHQTWSYNYHGNMIYCLFFLHDFDITTKNLL